MSESVHAATRLVSALRSGAGLTYDYIYRMSFEDYCALPDPFPRTTFTVREVQESVYRYPDPQRPGELFQWDIHGCLLEPAEISMSGIAMVMIHGGAANEYEFLFTPDGPEEYVDLTRTGPTRARVGVAQHIASLGIPVLAVSLPGHFSRDPWPPVGERSPEFVIGRVPEDAELANRLAVYTFRMCTEALKVLVEKNLAEDLYMWGHSTGGEFPFLMEQYGLRNRILGGIGYGSGVPAWIRRDWDDRISDEAPEQRAAPYRAIAGLSRRSPEGYTAHGYTGPNQPWGDAETWFARENHRRPQFKPFLQTIEHNGYDVLLPEIKRVSGLDDEELLITDRADLNRLGGKRLLHIVGERDHGHWYDGGEHGDLARGREVFGFNRFRPYAAGLRLVVVDNLTHYGHIEAFNERLANLMVTGFKEYLLGD